MTEQAHEILIYKGYENRMASDPFLQYLLKEKIVIKFISNSTGCMRGYMGKWEIKDDKLYLIDFQAQAYIQDLHQFPGEIERIKNYFHQVSIPKETAKSSLEMKINLTQKVNLSIKTFFPNQNIVFADWFNGIIRLQMGKLLLPINTGFASIYEEDVFLKLVNGILVDSNNVKNEPREGVLLPPPPR